MKPSGSTGGQQQAHGDENAGNAPAKRRASSEAQWTAEELIHVLFRSRNASLQNAR